MAPLRVDLGTADELALDILLNALSTFSREQLGIRQVVVGGQNDDWPTPKASPHRLAADPGACQRRPGVGVSTGPQGQAGRGGERQAAARSWGLPLRWQQLAWRSPLSPLPLLPARRFGSARRPLRTPSPDVPCGRCGTSHWLCCMSAMLSALPWHADVARLRMACAAILTHHQPSPPPTPTPPPPPTPPHIPHHHHHTPERPPCPFATFPCCVQREEFLPEVTMDPLRGPLRRGGGYDDEDADEDDGYFP